MFERDLNDATGMDILFQELSRGEMSISCTMIDAQSSADIGSAEGYLSEYGDLVSVIKINHEFQGKGLGFRAFDKAFSELNTVREIKRIIGGWHKDDEFSYCEGGMSTNLRLFNESISSGIDPILSAWNTPTGKWAKRKGFAHCKIISQSLGSVEVAFY